MKNAQKQFTSLIFLFLFLTGGLFLLDYEGLSNDTPTSLVTQTLKNWMDSSPLNQQLINSTSLAGSKMNLLSSNQTFLGSHLSVNKPDTVQHHSIPEFDIGIDLILSRKPQETMQKLIKTPQKDFSFHVINEKTFYLNQEPPEKKTHNYLTRQIGRNIVGFIYPPLHHQKVLEIIDALEENE